MSILLNAFTNFLSKNWMLILLLVIAILILVPSFLRQKKEIANRNELNNTIKAGTKIVTTAGVYGVVQSIRETTDGKVVTIVTGNAKNPTTMDIHINAIMGVDNKTLVTEEAPKTESVEKKEETAEQKEEPVKEESVEEKTETKKTSTQTKKPATKKSSSKSTTKKSTK